MPPGDNPGELVGQILARAAQTLLQQRQETERLLQQAYLAKRAQAINFAQFLLNQGDRSAARQALDLAGISFPLPEKSLTAEKTEAEIAGIKAGTEAQLTNVAAVKQAMLFERGQFLQKQLGPQLGREATAALASENPAALAALIAKAPGELQVAVVERIRLTESLLGPLDDAGRANAIKTVLGKEFKGPDELAMDKEFNEKQIEKVRAETGLMNLEIDRLEEEPTTAQLMSLANAQSGVLQALGNQHAAGVRRFALEGRAWITEREQLEENVAKKLGNREKRAKDKDRLAFMKAQEMSSSFAFSEPAVFEAEQTARDAEARTKRLETTLRTLQKRILGKEDPDALPKLPEGADAEDIVNAAGFGEDKAKEPGAAKPALLPGPAADEVATIEEMINTLVEGNVDLPGAGAATRGPTSRDLLQRIADASGFSVEEVRALIAERTKERAAERAKAEAAAEAESVETKARTQQRIQDLLHGKKR